MFTLSEALEFISSWVPPKSPNGQVLYPILDDGLSYEEIQQQVKDLPFELPSEVYELYQWSNGGFLGNLPYPNLDSYKGDYEKIHDFIPLEKAVTIAKDWGNNSFPLFAKDKYMCFTVGAKKQQKTAPIFCNDSQTPDKPRFDSLTTMMIKLVEAMKYEHRNG